MNPTVENVLSVYRSASAAQVHAGMEWYINAHEYAKSLDSRFHRAAGVIAALSPMNQWDNNMTKAARVYAQQGIIEWRGTKNGIGLANNVRKAVAIYNGDDALDVLGGDKVRAFFLSIADPAGDHPIVIDRHAFDVAVGKRTNDKVRRSLERKGEYERFSTAYRDAAYIVGIGPAQLQAVTWCAWKGRHGLV
jgi:hypothetical protein